MVKSKISLATSLVVFTSMVLVAEQLPLAASSSSSAIMQDSDSKSHNHNRYLRGSSSKLHSPRLLQDDVDGHVAVAEEEAIVMEERAEDAVAVDEGDNNVEENNDQDAAATEEVINETVEEGTEIEAVEAVIPPPSQESEATPEEQAMLDAVPADEIIDEVVDIDNQLVNLEDQEEYPAVLEAEDDLEALAEVLIESTFPEECNWECYLVRYNNMDGQVEHTEEAAIAHWIESGKNGGWDCSCPEVVEGETQAPDDGIAVEGEGNAETENAEQIVDDQIVNMDQSTEGEVVDETQAMGNEDVPEGGGEQIDEVIEEVENIEDGIEQLEALGDNPAAAQAEEGLEDAAEQLIEETFPPGCTWECYMDRYGDLAAAVGRSEEAAIAHWLGSGKGGGWDCSCPEVVEGETQAPDDGIAVEGEGDTEALPPVEELYEEFEQIEKELDELEVEDDDGVDEKAEGLEELKEEILDEMIEEELDEALEPDDDLGGENYDSYEGVEDLEEDLDQMEQVVEALEAEDNDGQFAEEREGEIEYLKKAIEDVQNKLQHEIQMENELSALLNDTLTAFHNGESTKDQETLAISDWGNWHIMKLGVGVVVTSLVVLGYMVYSRKFVKKARQSNDSNVGYGAPGGFRDDDVFA